MHRAAAPAALAALALAAVAAVAVTSRGTGDAPAAATAGEPVLSARRAVSLLARPMGRARLAAALDDLVAADAGPSCLLVTAGDDVLFEHAPDLPLVPASGMKLLTATAALAALGPDAMVPGGGPPATVGDLVATMLRESDNATADRLLAAVGASAEAAVGASAEAAVGASAEAAVGRAAALDALTTAGLPVDGVTVADGSGLDRGNRATCRALHAVVARASHDGPVVRGLPVAGESGTLATRFRDPAVAGRLRAKTGSIRGVATLVGLIDTPGGRLAFAHVTNGAVDPEAGARLHDRLVAALAAFPDVDLEPFGPAGGPAGDG